MSGGLTTYYSNPAFRPGVNVCLNKTNASFSYYGTEFEIDFDAELGSDVELCVDALRFGADVNDPALLTDGRSHIHELLTVFDRYGFLTDANWTRPGVSLSGRAFWRELNAFARQVKARFPFAFSAQLAEGRIDAAKLVLYATQYYHVVRIGPRIIAGALAHAARPRTQRLLENFLIEETGHDRLLAEALRGAGLPQTMIDSSMPLPETFALTSYLQVLAEQEPLSFAGTIFLMEEENAEFHVNFVQACHRAGLGESFYGPIKRHAHINDDGDHGNISAELLEDVDLVSPEETTVVKKHLVGLIECLSEIDRAVSSHASQSERPQQ